jgi:hypothetical protein
MKLPAFFMKNGQHYKGWSFLKIHLPPMRSNTAIRKYFGGLPGLGQALLKSSLSVASAISRKHQKRQNWWFFRKFCQF